MYRHCNGSMLRYHISRERLLERLCIAIVWRLPRRLVMWCAIRVIAHATQGQFSTQVVPELGAMEALQRWDVPHTPPPGSDETGEAHASPVELDSCAIGAPRQENRGMRAGLGSGQSA
jgi:hypothetical protein